MIRPFLCYVLASLLANIFLRSVMSLIEDTPITREPRPSIKIVAQQWWNNKTNSRVIRHTTPATPFLFPPHYNISNKEINQRKNEFKWHFIIE